MKIDNGTRSLVQKYARITRRFRALCDKRDFKRGIKGKVTWNLYSKMTKPEPSHDCPCGW